MTKIKPTVASLFSGAGGLDLGFSWSGYNIVWANEIDSDAAATYVRYLGDHLVQGDIRDHIRSIPSVDVLIGGPPCQSFSLVGKRRADDPRGALVYAFVDALEAIKPQAFIMENVPGLLSSRLGEEKLLDVIVADFQQMGYSIRVESLLATEYLVPQLRKRVFIIGWRGATQPLGLSELEPAFPRNKTLEMKLPISVSEALGDLPGATYTPTIPTEYARSCQNQYQAFMRADSATVLLHHMPTMSAKDREFVRHIPPGGNYTNIPDDISTTRIMNFKRTGGRTTTYGRLHPDRPAYTINTYFNRPNVGANYHYREERLITVREALRLQSFPDSFTPTFRTQRSLHQQIGNAVPPLLAYHIARSLLPLFQ